MSRRAAREKALQVLYQSEIGQVEVEEAIEDCLRAGRLDDGTREFASRLASGTWHKKQEVDGVIVRNTYRWKIDRLANVERNILRLAVYEMLYEPEIPDDVSIDEAVELAKKYSSDRAAGFINGILDGIKKELARADEEQT